MPTLRQIALFCACWGLSWVVVGAVFVGLIWFLGV